MFKITNTPQQCRVMFITGGPLSKKDVFSFLLNVVSDKLLSSRTDSRLLHTVGPRNVKLCYAIVGFNVPLDTLQVIQGTLLRVIDMTLPRMSQHRRRWWINQVMDQSKR